MDNIVHFETLYERCEKLTEDVYKDKTIEDILNLLSDAVLDYKEMMKSDITDDIKKSLKKRSIGEIMFLITAITQKDGIDVYSALLDEMKINS